MPLRSGCNFLARFWGLSVRRQFLIGTSTMVACLLTLLVSAFHTASISREAAARVQHTQKIIDVANQAVNAIVDMETGYRGFLLTGQIDFLEPYESGRESFTRQMSALEQDKSLEPTQAERWAQVRQL